MDVDVHLSYKKWLVKLLKHYIIDLHGWIFSIWFFFFPIFLKKFESCNTKC
jgi:hypothetical protein